MRKIFLTLRWTLWMMISKKKMTLWNTTMTPKDIVKVSQNNKSVHVEVVRSRKRRSKPDRCASSGK